MNHSKLLSVLRLAVVSMALVVATALQAQTVNVKGVVTEAATGETVIGASISEVGTTNGTITDFDGNFSLQVHSGAQLEISYVGFKTVTVAATPNMTIALEEDKAKSRKEIKALEEDRAKSKRESEKKIKALEEEIKQLKEEMKKMKLAMM